MKPTIISRRAAFEQGERYFYTGNGCGRGHDADRFVSSGACIECMRFTRPKKPARGNNVHWPPRPLIFPAGTTRAQADIAFRILEGWAPAAIDAARTAEPGAFAVVPHVKVVMPHGEPL